jgi:flagellar hook assembly protein FlgD
MTHQKVLGVLLSTAIMIAPVQAQKISGKITDALSKVPVANAKITLVELKKEIATDSTGFYAIEDLTKGTYSVRIEAPQYVQQTKSVKIIDAKGQTGTTDITLDVLLFSLSSDVDQSKGQKVIKYFFPGHTDVIIDVCDSTGKAVRQVFDRTRIGGMRTFRWDGTDNWGKSLPGGKYTCKFKSGNLYTSRILIWAAGEEKK